jgi:hypothetical protein
MDIIKISMVGYGCEIARGTITPQDHKKVKNIIDNVWHKNLFKKLKKQIDIKTYSKDLGIINGDIKVELNDEVILDNQISTLEVLNIIEIKNEQIKYPKTNDVVITTVQHQEGIICDNIFITAEDFDVTLLKLVKKNIIYNVDKPLVASLYCDLYYDDEKIHLTDSNTDLRTSRLYLEKIKRNGKNKNR